MRLFVLFILAFASKQKETTTEDDTARGEFVSDGYKAKEMRNFKNFIGKNQNNERGSFRYFGVLYDKTHATWRAQRLSKNNNTMVYNGTYNNKTVAARASDTLARKLMENGDQNLKLNFPDDEIEVYKRRDSSDYIGVSSMKNGNWRAIRWSKHKRKVVLNGCYATDEEAAHASDTLARQLMKNGEQSHKINFPEDDTEVYAEKKSSSEYIGVSFNKKGLNWRVHRWSKTEKKKVSNGYYDTEEAAAHSSDTLARKLMKNGEQGHQLNFPSETEVHQEHEKKRKRSGDLQNLQDN